MTSEQPTGRDRATGRPASSHARLKLSFSEQQLAQQALAVLEVNWLGHATRPGRLYPHQWSWDAACIAMGRAAWDQERAERELRSLFAGQWSNGMVPHIVFTNSDQYFPGPTFWQTERSADAPAQPRTSGIVQPPVHATAAWRLYLAAGDRPRAAALLADLLPHLVAWHEYLYRERSRGDGLVEIWHPWESGMDNSPAWDDPLARMALTREQIPRYTRADNRLGRLTERPSQLDYDRYVYLVAFFRERSYDSARIRESCPFAVQPVLFNSLLIQANRDLAKIAGVVGASTVPFEHWAEITSAGLTKLWDAGQSLYFDYDVRAEKRVTNATAAAFTPLYAGVPTPDGAERLIERLTLFGAPLGEDLWAVPSVSREDPHFQPSLYWRGPIWPMLQWVVQQGAARYGHSDLSDRIRLTTIELCRRDGFWEHYNPQTGRGQGEAAFAWTAGLVLDLLAGQHPSSGG